MEDNNEGNGAIDSTQRKLAELITYFTSEPRTQASRAKFRLISDETHKRTSILVQLL
jgi:hypothetical protein